ncbi:MAG: EutQ-like cupin domain [Solirubrobacteraceae bacterium]
MPTVREQVVARCRHVELRVCERDPAGEAAAPPDAEHDHVAYVQEGALIVSVAGSPPVELHAGDSYVVPAGERCRFEVLEPAKVVEAIGPAL